MSTGFSDRDLTQVQDTLSLAHTFEYQDGSVEFSRCTGFFLNKGTLIATAAHCIARVKPIRKVTVLAWGGVYRDKQGVTLKPYGWVQVDAAFSHPLYAPAAPSTSLSARYDSAIYKVPAFYRENIV